MKIHILSFQYYECIFICFPRDLDAESKKVCVQLMKAQIIKIKKNKNSKKLVNFITEALLFENRSSRTEDNMQLVKYAQVKITN